MREKLILAGIIICMGLAGYLVGSEKQDWEAEAYKWKGNYYELQQNANIQLAQIQRENTNVKQVLKRIADDPDGADVLRKLKLTVTNGQ